MSELDDIRSQFARLERRLARERDARMQAEAIAEKGLRELYVRQKELTLVETIATYSNQSRSVAHALQFALDRICAFAEWPLGHAYLVKRDRKGAPVLSPTSIWSCADRAAYAPFRAATEKLRMISGHGLPGRVLLSGLPAWISDISADVNFPRAQPALACSLRAGMAFPVLVGAEVVAVLEFFSERTLPPDEAMMRCMEHVGAQLGRTIERNRAERGLRAKNVELRKLVQETEAQRRAAEAASHAKSAFLAVTSHEVRTPLNAVLGLAEALRRQPLSTDQVALVDEIIESGAMLLRLLNAVLDLSKIEAGKMTADLGPVDLRRRVRIVAGVWRARAEELGLNLVVDLSGLPDPCVVQTDEGKVEQTLVNLISNALKFSPREGTVAIHAERLGGEAIRIDVSDEGDGVADDDLERIFRPFEQTDAGRAAGGAGLGLSICRGNMDLLAGRIGAERRAVRGSRFWFAFPAPAVEAEIGAPLRAETPTFDRPLRVLAAEDHPANRQVLRALLGPAGVDLTLVENGREAVDAVVLKDFDLVLMDANMPVMNGPDAVAAIRALPGGADKPVYMLTANAFEDDVRRYLAAGADAVLAKPVDLHALYDALAAAAGARERLAARNAA
jgi:signal transduction histidine kinase